jgi:hypothetical protein
VLQHRSIKELITTFNCIDCSQSGPHIPYNLHGQQVIAGYEVIIRDVHFTPISLHVPNAFVLEGQRPESRCDFILLIQLSDAPANVHPAYAVAAGGTPCDMLIRLVKRLRIGAVVGERLPLYGGMALRTRPPVPDATAHKHNSGGMLNQSPKPPRFRGVVCERYGFDNMSALVLRRETSHEGRHPSSLIRGVQPHTSEPVLRQPVIFNRIELPGLNDLVCRFTRARIKINRTTE